MDLERAGEPVPVAGPLDDVRTVANLGNRLASNDFNALDRTCAFSVADSPLMPPSAFTTAKEPTSTASSALTGREPAQFTVARQRDITMVRRWPIRAARPATPVWSNSSPSGGPIVHVAPFSEVTGRRCHMVKTVR